MLAAFVAEQDPGLARITIRETMPPRELWLLVHSDLRRAPRIRATLDFIVNLVEQKRPLLSGKTRSLSRPIAR
jgi:DNA-binding transcriptional LysR family regulator